MNRKGFSPIIMIGIVAALIVAGVIGYFVWKNSSAAQLQPTTSASQSTSSTSPSIMSSSSTPSEASTPTTADAEDYAKINASAWGHYNNETYDFSFTYPGFLFVNGDSNSSSIVLSENATSALSAGYAFSASFIPNPNDLSVKQYFSNDAYDNGANLYSQSTVSTTTVDGVAATEFNGAALYGVTTDEIDIVPYQGGFLEIVDNGLDDYTYHWILSSFSLVSPAMTQAVRDASNITTSSVLATITNWNNYAVSSTYQFRSDSDCAPANPQFAAYINKANANNQVFGQNIGDYEILYTPNYYGWTFNEVNTMEGGSFCYPGADPGIEYAYPGKLIWTYGCGGGVDPVCEKAQSIVDDYFQSLASTNLP